MLSRREQYAILLPSGEIIGSDPNTCNEVIEEPSGFMSSISSLMCAAEADDCRSGAAWPPATEPDFESTSVMLRMAATPMDGSACTNTIFSFNGRLPAGAL